MTNFFKMLFFISPRKIKIEIDSNEYLGIEESVPVKVGINKLNIENNKMPILGDK